MKLERFAELWKQRGPACDNLGKGMTAEESEEIYKVWDELPSMSSFYDAFVAAWRRALNHDAQERGLKLFMVAQTRHLEPCAIEAMALRETYPDERRAIVTTLLDLPLGIHQCAVWYAWSTDALAAVEVKDRFDGHYLTIERTA